MRLAPFRLHRPASVEEATAILDEHGPDALAYCGGTELLLIAKLGLTDFSDLVDVKTIGELGGLEAEDSGELRIGATVTHRTLERSPLVRERWPSLAEMERGVANLRVRNVGTIGGNLCFADPHSDPATWLLAAGGEVSVRRGAAPSRRLPIGEFVRGPYETALEGGELLVAVHVPAPAPRSALIHRKMSFQERPAITVSVSVELDDGRVGTARVAVGSVGVRPARVPGAEAALAGASAEAPADAALAAAGEAAAAVCEPVADANGSVEYKRQLARVLTARCAREAIAQAALA
jgi:carbon-monoxide dehydrogenase medium subunit